MAQSKEYLCPNTGMSLWVEYAYHRLMIRDPDEPYPMFIPFGLLVRVLEKEPQLRAHVLTELEQGVVHE